MDVYGEPGCDWPIWARNSRKSLDVHHVTVTRLLQEVYALVKENERQDIMTAMIDVGRSDFFQLHTFVKSMRTEFYVGESSARITKMAKEEKEAIEGHIYNLYTYGSHRWVTTREEDYLYINIIPEISNLSHSCLCGECARENFTCHDTSMPVAPPTTTHTETENDSQELSRTVNIDYDEHPPFQFRTLDDIPWFDENSTLDDIADALALMEVDEDEYEDVPVTMSLEDYYSAVEMVSSKEDKACDCCICLEKCSKESPNAWRNILVKTACGHVYHNMCLQRLCCETGPPKCPICRHDIREKLMIDGNQKHEKVKED